MSSLLKSAHMMRMVVTRTLIKQVRSSQTLGFIRSLQARNYRFEISPGRSITPPLRRAMCITPHSHTTLSSTNHNHWLRRWPAELGRSSTQKRKNLDLQETQVPTQSSTALTPCSTALMPGSTALMPNSMALMPSSTALILQGHQVVATV